MPLMLFTALFLADFKLLRGLGLALEGGRFCRKRRAERETIVGCVYTS